jgi:hypothetical protein
VWPQDGQAFFGDRIGDQDQRLLAGQGLLQALLASDCHTHPEAADVELDADMASG